MVENTIGSLKEAGEHGADYVEFDVQLTKDLVPVVYHDFHVCTTLAKTGFSSGELYEMHVKELTLHQLHSLRLEHTSVLDEQGKDVAFSRPTIPRLYSSSSGIPVYINYTKLHIDHSTQYIIYLFLLSL